MCDQDQEAESCGCVDEECTAWCSRWGGRSVIQSVEDFLHEQDELFYQSGVQKLQKRLITCKCIEVLEIM